MADRDDLTVLLPPEGHPDAEIRETHDFYQRSLEQLSRDQKIPMIVGSILQFNLKQHSPRQPALIGPDGSKHVLPIEMFEVLSVIASAMTEGKAVTIALVEPQMTTQQAADLLKIRRSALVQLLDEGEIQYETVGRHRRVQLADVLQYRRKRSARRREALDELVAISEDAGLYETTLEPAPTR